MKTERELNLLEGKINVLKASIDDMPGIRFVTKPEILSTIKVDNSVLGGEEDEYDLGRFSEVLVVGNQAINTNATSVNTIVNVLLMSYLNQQGWKEPTAYKHGLIGTITDLGSLKDLRPIIL